MCLEFSFYLLCWFRVVHVKRSKCGCCCVLCSCIISEMMIGKGEWVSCFCVGGSSNLLCVPRYSGCFTRFSRSYAPADTDMSGLRLLPSWPFDGGIRRPWFAHSLFAVFPMTSFTQHTVDPPIHPYPHYKQPQCLYIEDPQLRACALLSLFTLDSILLIIVIQLIR